MRSIFAVLLLISALGAGCQRQPTDQSASPRAAGPKVTPEPMAHLQLGREIQNEMVGGEVHVFPLRIEGKLIEGTLIEGKPSTRTLLEVDVEQQGIDTVVRLLTADREPVLEVDGLTGAYGVESLVALVRPGEVYRLELEAFPSPNRGRYQVFWKASRPASTADTERALAIADVIRGDHAWSAGDEGAAASLRHALERVTAAGDGFWQAEANERLGRIASERDQWTQARDHFQTAIDRYQQVGATLRQGLTCNQLGDVLQRLGQLEDAHRSYEEALRLTREAGSPQGEAAAFNNLGLSWRARGELQRSLDHYGQALVLWERLGQERERAITWLNLGQLQLELGQAARGLDLLHGALDLFDALGDRRNLGIALDNLAGAHRDAGRPDEALEAYERALALWQELGSRRSRAVTESNLARLLQDLEDFDRATVLYRQARKTFAELGDRGSEARTIQLLAALDRIAGRLPEAEAGYRQALAIYRELGDPLQESEAIYNLARIAGWSGRLAESSALFEEALTLEENLRREVISPSHRLSRFASFHHRYQESIAVLMERHRSDPQAGFDTLAFRVSERSRARSWIELWLAAGGLVSDEAALASERRARGRLAELARQLDAARDAAERHTLDRQLRAAREDWQAARGRQRPASPEIPILNPADIAERVLDAETRLLEFTLGEKGSFLWLIGPDGLQAFDLPPRFEIEALARRAHQLLSASHRREVQPLLQAVLCELSGKLLGPVADRLASQVPDDSGSVGRLALVVEGALHYVPFAALPDPRFLDSCRDAPPLVEFYEIVYLPSASALDVQRQMRGARKAEPSKDVVVMADPVFGPDDPRSKAVPRESEAPWPRLPRLSFSGEEASAILALAGSSSSAWLGLQANKARALSGALAGYSYVHLATHGRLDGEHPELSSLALSRVDERGHAVDGFLRLHELPQLDLDAELVVLSACETALGQEVRGDGLIGLAQGFFEAGAERVLVSLWKVDDASTRQLMESFYRALLIDELSPAAALRHAQRTLRQQTTMRTPFSAPFFWAPFVVHGDWR